MSETRKPDERLRGVSLNGRCICGNEPTCIGNYEGAGVALGCNACCGHGNEDGWCVPIEDERHARELVTARAEGFAAARERAVGIAQAKVRAYGGVAADIVRDIRAMEDEQP